MTTSGRAGTMPSMETAWNRLSSELAGQGTKTVALYGAGQHTQRLLAWLHQFSSASSLVVACVMDDAKTGTVQGLPVIAPAAWRSVSFDALVISSDSIEQALFERAKALQTGKPVHRLYTTDRLAMSPRVQRLLEAIKALPSDWHKAGTMQSDVLDAMARAAASMSLDHTVETGTGKTTLLLSHLSKHHTVFALDGSDGSMSAVRASPLFRRKTTRLVAGPTQLKVPRHRFKKPLDLALIDGPHGYPFPEIEYYFIYPHLKPGALLILDDIHIPTIQHLFRFLREDAMFALEQVVLTTAFFRRTEAPVFSPTGDGWWLQGFNRAQFPIAEHPGLRELLGR